MLFQSTPIPWEGMANLLQYWVHHTKNPREEPNAITSFVSVLFIIVTLFFITSTRCTVIFHVISLTCNVER